MEGRAIVIGIGNTLREDDGLGPAVVASLRGRVPDRVELVTVEKLTAEWAGRISKVDKVAFVDAAPNLEPGRYVSSVVVPADRAPSGGDLDPRAVLALTHRLYGRIPAARLFLIGAEKLGHGEGLSPATQSMLPFVSESVRAFLRRDARTNSPTVI